MFCQWKGIDIGMLFYRVRIDTVLEVKWHLQGYTTNKQKVEKIKPPTSSSSVKIRLHPAEEEEPKDIAVITNKRKANERTMQLEDQRFNQITPLPKFFTLEAGIFLFPTSQGRSGRESRAEIGCLNPDCPETSDSSQLITGDSRNFRIPRLCGKASSYADGSPASLWGPQIPGKRLAARGLWDWGERSSHLPWVFLPISTLLWSDPIWLYSKKYHWAQYWKKIQST